MASNQSKSTKTYFNYMLIDAIDAAHVTVLALVFSTKIHTAAKRLIIYAKRSAKYKMHVSPGELYC